ncbi:unnamed protein product [Urochloa decumbens]|uniref:Uncharacterized protein n=1 Tax=Urochloa decumbens TaxID=240449 RepID=A0ABC9DZA8_9POAL
MGSGLSSTHHHHRRSTASLHQPPSAAAAPALVVAADGSLREFAPASSPVSASDVLLTNAAAEDGSFLCSSDALYFDADVPALGADELLRPGQIYFVLPAAMLGRPLSSADMAALAVRASDALAAPARTAGSNNGRARRGGVGFGVTKARVVPAMHHADGAEAEVNEKLNQRTLGGFETTAARSAKGSVPATRAPMRRALSTIIEDAD